MQQRHSSGGLYDPRRGDVPIRTRGLEFSDAPAEPVRTNYFNIYLIESGSGNCWADTCQFQFGARTMLFFVPYQHIRFSPATPVRAELIQFHANFLCVETFHAEVGCSGILFNDPHGSPLVELNRATYADVTRLIRQLQKEQANDELASEEMMLAQLKILLILATRLKTSGSNWNSTKIRDARHPLLTEFREMIEQHYRSLHTPAEYAERLHVSAKTLGRVVRESLGTTPTNLIRNRILTHAKWQLLHTLKPVKEVARELGFSDELYFSRLFKKGTGYSPTFFREFETEIRGGSNLSMLSSTESIQTPA
ncbi:helix-turn-helix domain-containing protein [Planctomicrobium sp. SH661]|uniref:helix-turn-helix domain-containing protein n=1 Tax=Planctomicrobium sp. SH661 TaxID=3448124 RepID=UPI003F5BAB4F